MFARVSRQLFGLYVASSSRNDKGDDFFPPPFRGDAHDRRLFHRPAPDPAFQPGSLSLGTPASSASSSPEVCEPSWRMVIRDFRGSPRQAGM